MIQYKCRECGGSIQKTITTTIPPTHCHECENEKCKDRITTEEKKHSKTKHCRDCAYFSLTQVYQYNNGLINEIGECWKMPPSPIAKGGRRVDGCHDCDCFISYEESIGKEIEIIGNWEGNRSFLTPPEFYHQKPNLKIIV